MSHSSDDWNVVKMLEWATKYFANKEIPSPRLSIEWILSHVLGVPRLHLYMQYDRPLTDQELQTLRPLILRRSRHEPLQYITGTTDFYTCDFFVTPAVLIPRPETEELIEHILNDFSEQPGAKQVLDLGTGSGCIAISLKKAQPNWLVTGIDISREALEVATKNARHNATDVTFLHADFKTSWPGATLFEIIVSNPPYVLDNERPSLEKQVRDFEPETALFTPTLEEIYQPVISQSQNRLHPHGKLYFELHEDHADLVLSLFDPAIWVAEKISDYAGKDRFIRAHKKQRP